MTNLVKFELCVFCNIKYYFRSRLACGSQCALDNACSAFSFARSSNICQLGYKGGQVPANSSTPQSQMTTIHTKPGENLSQNVFYSRTPFEMTPITNLSIIRISSNEKFGENYMLECLDRNFYFCLLSFV